MRDSACHSRSPLAWLRGAERALDRHVLVADADMTSSERVDELFDRGRRTLRAGVRHMVIDLHEVRSVDTKLLACIVVLYQMARAASVRLEICLSAAVLELARICRLEGLALELAGRGSDEPALATEAVCIDATR